MDKYNNVLLFVLKTVAIGNSILLGIILLTVIVSIILKNKIDFKKIISVCATLFICVLAEFSFFSIPRLIDIKEQNYITIENASIDLEAMNDYDGSFLVYGLGSVKDSDGNSLTLTGTELINLPTDSSPHQVLNGTIVYAKYSKQIVDFQETKQ
ncbi:MAG: hypothetical protein BHW39_01120 [Firmicutes bacterium CAG:552_39_19]|jgi:hypothetical protein|nr:MAG: hypothetical protein BHW39_01120 [Firmicutes bacterium CAG:552_39_19]